MEGMDMKKHFLPLLLCCTLLTGCAAAGADTKQVREIPGDVDIPQLVSAETAEGGYAAFAAELLQQAADRRGVSLKLNKETKKG